MGGMHRLTAVPVERMHLTLMLVLTFATGVVDAVGYLGLDRVFTGNMTGNVVILGMGLVGADDLPVLGPVLALCGFLAGAAVGGRVLRSAAGPWTPVTTRLFLVVGAVMIAAAVVLLVLGEDIARGPALLVTTSLGAAMGLQAATARVVAVRDVTTVVVTSTITALAADSVLGAGRSGSTGRRVLAVLLILAGAAVGAAMLRLQLGAGLLLAGALVLGVTLLGGAHGVAHERWGSWPQHAGDQRRRPRA